MLGTEMRIIHIIWLSYYMANTACAQGVLTPIANLSQNSAGTEIGVGSGDSLAISFTTGNVGCEFDGASLAFDAAGSAGFGPMAVGLCADSGGIPGSVIAQLSGNPYPTNSADYFYSASSGVTLATNTTFWLTAYAYGPVYYLWSSTPSSALDAGSVWKLGSFKGKYNGVWANNSYYPRFSITVTNPVVPAISVFAPTVFLTFLSPGFSFELQASTNVNSTSWAAADNVVTNGIEGNQTFFVVRQTSPQMFYRLQLK
jgi:hypothetical protein